jgi:crotonobetainyl-CoA:carnitine CoA-transferase CaiB-like acyl-CoA transferase
MSPTERCLSGLRVVDCTDEAGQLAARILADLGAEVIHIDPPGGDPSRQRGPSWGPRRRRRATAAPRAGETGVQWMVRNAGKQIATFSVDHEEGRVQLHALLEDADVFLTSGPPDFLDRHGFGFTALRARNPRLVMCAITPYGTTGPYRTRRGSDLTVIAASGNLFLTGEPDRPPLRCSMPVSHYHGGAEAAFAVLAALWDRDRSGRGQFVDVSLQETMLITSMSHPAQAALTGALGKRAGAYMRAGEVVMREIWPCKDGYVTFGLRGGAARVVGLIALITYMDEHGMAPPALKARDWKSYNHNRVTQEEIDQISEPIAAFFLTKTMRELYEAACVRNLLLAPANTEREILASRQLDARDFFTTLEDPRQEGRLVPMPGGFANWAPARVAPTALVRGEADCFPEEPVFGLPAAPPPDEGAGIFRGLRIVEFGAGAAVPLATRYFADQGATVVKVESRQRPDFLRLLRDDGSGQLDASLMFNILNCNKLSAALNLRDPRGPKLARRLIGWADVVVENFAPGVMEKWGLTYARLAPELPRLIMVSACLWGQTGPERTYPGFGGQGSALAGFNYLTGWPDREPLGPFGTITDSLSPRCAATAIAAALLHRARTGRGTYVDLSQVEAGVYCLSEWLVAYEVTGESFGRIGNRARDCAPHGVFPTAEPDHWVALAVHDDADWQRLLAAMEHPPWATRAEYGAVAGRLANIDRLEEDLACWTALHPAAPLVARLQAAGIDAMVVATMQDVLRDPQLAHRGHFQRVTHPVTGEHLVEANGIRFSASPHLFAQPAPCLGADNDRVYRELLGLSAREFDELTAEGVLA